MFTNHRRQQERTGRSGTPRVEYLQELVSEFQNADKEETKERVVAHLANFAYDPYNFTFLRQLNVLELFLDCVTEPNEKLVEFGVGGICNACADPANVRVITDCGGIPLIIECLSSPVKNTALREAQLYLQLKKSSFMDPSVNFVAYISSQGVHVDNTKVNYALGSLYYICNPVTKEEILKPEVIEVIKRYAAAGSVSISFSNLAKAFLDKHLPDQT